jgi:hypothetical protein
MPGWAEVSGREPFSISHLESGLLPASVRALCLLGLKQVFSEDPVSLLLAFEQDVRFGPRFEAAFCRHPKLHLGMSKIHCPELGHPGRRVHRVVICEFRQR